MRNRTRREVLLAGATFVGFGSLEALHLQNVGGAERAARRSRIVAACIKHWPGQKHDCSGFVKAVAADLGVSLSGQANDIYKQIRSAGWTAIGTGLKASRIAGVSASEGNFVVGASQATPNGHVAIIVDYRNAFDSYDPKDRSKAVAFWGSKGSVGEEYYRITESWSSTAMESVYFAYRNV
jgi:hypothetical protein